MKIVFMGTPEFASEALKALANEHEVVAVYTKEPKECGRGKKLLRTPVHIWAEEHGIEVRTPKTLRNEAEQKAFADLKADIAVVVAYGLILPQPILEAFPNGCVNIHGSILPRWRGAAPIQRCIEAGDKISGITTMKMDVGLDTGDMLLKGEVEITSDTTGGELHDKLAAQGAELITRTLRDWDKIVPQKQNDTFATYAHKIEKSESLIDYSMKAVDLELKIRAFNPYPAIFFEHDNERFKILKAKVSDEKVEQGKLMQTGNRLFIGCCGSSLEVLEIQRQSKSAMACCELLRGYTFKC